MIISSGHSAKQSPDCRSVGILLNDVDVRRVGDSFFAGWTFTR